MGFGWFNQLFGEDSFDLIFKVIVDSTEFPEITIKFTKDMIEKRQPEDYCDYETFLIDFEKYLGKNIDVKAGSEIHFLCKAWNDEDPEV
jgi:hypothetical protein